MNVKLDLSPLYAAEIYRMAGEVGVSSSEIVTGIVKIYIDRRASEKRPHARKGAIQDQHGQVYDSVKQACQKLGLHAPLVYCVLRGTRPSTGGYTFSRV
jgi:hypothetical protein